MDKEKGPTQEYAEWKAPEEGTTEVVDISLDLPKKPDGNIDYSEILQQGREGFNEHIKNVSIKALLKYMELGGIDFMKVREIRKPWRLKLKTELDEKGAAHILNTKLSFISESQAAQMALQELLRRIDSGEI